LRDFRKVCSVSSNSCGISAKSAPFRATPAGFPQSLLRFEQLLRNFRKVCSISSNSCGISAKSAPFRATPAEFPQSLLHFEQLLRNFRKVCSVSSNSCGISAKSAPFRATPAEFPQEVKFLWDLVRETRRKACDYFVSGKSSGSSSPDLWRLARRGVLCCESYTPTMVMVLLSESSLRI
jgi:hypothetical protein